jgi:4a-hydroxytetrahydrobiopterin dehydratase
MDASGLTERTCTACTPGTPALEEPQASELEEEIDPTWEREGTFRIRRTFRFPDFKRAFAFATVVALLAESQGHHPDLEVGWGKVAVTLTTHAARGLTENDFIMAAKIDKLAPTAKG